MDPAPATTQITDALRQLRDDVEQSESRPSADEICARLLAIEALVVAAAVRAMAPVMDAEGRDSLPLVTRKAYTSPMLPAPPPTQPVITEMPKPLAKPIKATHPRAAHSVKDRG